ncbi:lasso RiPP family leader peptide-containing protein [Streptomyces sp. NPDC005551]|uniref:lasso RiPP family leader peptide-containing protein n=1 Tax=unclassified Streptomyces TaxID=2593676 RepID=UPI00340D4B10
MTAGTGNPPSAGHERHEPPGRRTDADGPVRHRARWGNGYTLGPALPESRAHASFRSDPFFPGQPMPQTRGGPMTYEPIAVSPHEDSGYQRQTAGPGAEPSPDEPAAYEPPMLVDLGHVREVTLGSSPSGAADANAQYYY